MLSLEKLFGTKQANPPYSPTEGGISLNLENWETYLSGDKEYDDKYIYYKCSRDGQTWYHRENK
jgi:hypothetical protein